MHRAGARRVGDFDATHMLTSAHRATLQGWSDAKFPASMTEAHRRDLISQVVPPPFAERLAEAVAQCTRPLTRNEVRLVRLNQMSERDLGKLSESVSSMKESGAVDRGRHGRWQYYGQDFGWLRTDLAHKEVLHGLLFTPWNVIHEPPAASESMADWHRRNADRANRSKLEWAERMDMERHDSRSTEEVKRVRSHIFRNIDPEPDRRARYDSNANLQAGQPLWYGPYLDEGECYAKARSQENLDEACKKDGAQ